MISNKFDIGFYSAFLVADRVTVYSKNNDDEQYVWESSADGSFTIVKDNGEPIGRGTKVVLHIKEDQAEILSENKIRNIVSNNPKLIPYPIFVGKDRENQKSITIRSNKGKKKTQKIVENQAIWTRNPDEISKEEYGDFFKSLNNDKENPIAFNHFSAEEPHGFTA